MTSYVGIGCMSGSSLDGLDLCCVEFTGDKDTDVWGYKIIKAETISYDDEWTTKLREARDLKGEDLVKLHMDYGHLLGRSVDLFISNNNLSVEFVASHGHTIFHNPKQKYTFQLGDGETTSSYLSVPYVCNFRNKDVALGGQGAPFVPCGEKYLFRGYDICINLGGIANIGIQGHQGFDVCPCNYVSNKLAAMFDTTLQYDVDGIIAGKGQIIDTVLRQLDGLEFYRQSPPKSLGAEWIEENVMKVLDTNKYDIPDLMRTFVEHVANKLTEACLATKNYVMKSDTKEPQVLLTGGGAFNKTLVELFQQKLLPEGFQLVTTDDETICYKEALIFAFLGLKCLFGENNIFKNVTGSSSDSVSGSIHLPIVKQNASKSCVFHFQK